MDHATTGMGPLMVHLTGNQSLGQELFLSTRTMEPDEATRETLSRFFLNRFEHTFEQYRFAANGMAEMLPLCTEILNDPSSLERNSATLARRLYECASHPRIKPGELHVTTFSAFPTPQGTVRAVGLFKTENKNKFIEVKRQPNAISLEVREGIDLGKFDKGCLILETEDATDPVVLIVDQHARGEEAVYWREDFLGCEPRKTEFRQTAGVLQATREFVTGYIDQEFEVSKADKIDLLNKSVSYFKSHDRYEPQEFANDVLGDPQLIRTFKQFREEQGEDPFPRDSFPISAAAVRQQARVFRSVLKLDKNFHIYIHGNRELIQQGKDADGRKFYKIYYDTES